MPQFSNLSQEGVELLNESFSNVYKIALPSEENKHGLQGIWAWPKDLATSTFL